MAQQHELEPERRTIHIVDFNPETGEVPIRQVHVVDGPRQPGQRYSLLSINFGPALEKLEQLEVEDQEPFDGPRLYLADD